MKVIFIFLISVLACLFAFSQGSEKETLLKEIQKSNDDSLKVFKYYKYGEFYEQELPDTALFYYQKGLDLAKKIGYLKGICSYSSYAIVILNNRGQFSKGLALTIEALELYKKTGIKRDWAVGYINVANEWQYLGDFKLAIENYIEAANLAEQIQDLNLLRVSNNNIASVFLDMKDAKKGLPYAEKGLQIARKIKDEYGTASSLINLAVANTLLGQYSLATKNYKEVFQIAQKLDDKILELDAYNGHAENYSRAGQLNKGNYFYEKSLKLSQKIDAKEYLMIALGGMASNFVSVKNDEKAYKSIQQALKVGEIIGSRSTLMDYYLDASKIANRLGLKNVTANYLEQYQINRDSVMNEQKMSDIQLSEAKYQTEKKEIQIKLQTAQLKQKTTNNILLIGGLATLAILSLLGFINYQNRQRIDRQKIKELEQEKQLTAVSSIMQGQEEERSRMAKDLHDGLGGILSGIKLNLSAMRGNQILLEADANIFGRSIEQLDIAIKEMRRVAHNMMPEALLKFGLNEAVKDFCDGINQSGFVKMKYSHFGDTIPNDQSLQVILYRIIQELSNNAIKYANANTIFIQLTKHETGISLTVEDDGQGFDVATLEKNKGTGLSNVISRVNYLKGTFSVDSEIGKGTTCFVEIPNT